MRRLADQRKIAFYLLAESRRALHAHAERLNEDWGWVTESTNGKMRPVTASHVLDAILSRLYTLPAEEQDKFVREGREISEAHQQFDRSVGFGSADIRPKENGNGGEKKRGKKPA